MLNKKLILTAVVFLLSWAFFAQGNVGIGTTTPQAKLDVDGGNVRFSEYGTTLHTGTPEYLLGVEADGDIVEVAPREENRGLQFYYWEGFDVIPGSNDGTVPGIDVLDMRRLSTFVPASGTTPIGPPVNSGLYTGPLFLTHNGGGTSVDLDGEGIHPEIRIAGDRYLVIFKGTLEVVNTGLFTFNSLSNDGARILIDDLVVLNDWVRQLNGNVNASIVLTKGKHEVEFWSFENVSGDRIQFRWGANPDGYVVNSQIQATQFLIE